MVVVDGVRLMSGCNIVPWICHVCECEFGILSGGLCSWCSEPTCIEHLTDREVMGSRESCFICVKCLSPIEPAERKKKLKLFRWFD
jgi:hypothetical protein